MNKTVLIQPGQEPEYALFPLKYEWAWTQYKLMQKNFWSPDSVPMGTDKQEWDSGILSDAEEHMFLTVFAQLTTFDLLRTADLSQRLIPLVQAPEIIQALTTQAFQECVHTESYQSVIETIGLPQEDIYQRYRTVPALSNRIALSTRLGDINLEDKVGILRSLVHFFLVFESTWFRLNLLGPIQSLARRNMFQGTATQFVYIAIDEDSHVALGLHLIRSFLKEHPGIMTTDVVESIIEDTAEALELEDRFIEYALPAPILGYNANDHKATARFYLDTYLGRIGINPKFGGKHMFPWMDEMVSTEKEAAFFERRNTSYQVGAKLWDGDEDSSSQFDSVM